MHDPQDFTLLVQDALRPLADAQRALQMKAYLRSQFEFMGLPAPVRRAAVKELMAARFGDADSLLAAAQALWALPQREYRYTAVDLLLHQRRLLAAHHLPALQALLTDAPWWETVDGLSAVIGKVLAQHQALEATEDWIRHGSFWVRRSAMLHQLGWRTRTDSARLARHALLLAHEQEFFIRKGIGWALRDYARWNPDWVRAFIADHAGRLSALTVREAAKRL